MNVEKEERVLFAMAVKNLQDIGFWPKNGNKIPFIFGSWMWIIGVLMLWGVTGHIYKTIKIGKLSELLNDIFFLLIYLFASSTIAVFYFRGDDALRLHKKYNESKDCERIVQHIEKLTHFLYYYSVATNGMLLIFAYFSDQECFRMKAEGDGDGYICGVLFPAWFPIDLDHTPWKQMIHLIESIYIIYYTPKLACSLVFFYGGILITEGRIETLKLVLGNIRVAEDNSEEVLNELKRVARDYSDITLLVNDMNSTIGIIFSPSQYILLGLIISLLEFQVVVEKDRKAIPPLIFWFLFECLMCWKGQSLEDASVSLAQQVYEFPWYDLDPSARSVFRVFHGQVQVTLQMKCPPIISINFAYFYEVMKGSYSVLMYLRKMY